MRSFLCIGLIGKCSCLCHIWRDVFGKTVSPALAERSVFALFRGSGDFPSASQFRKFHLGNLRELSLCCHDIGSACYLWQTAVGVCVLYELRRVSHKHIRALPLFFCKILRYLAVRDSPGK